MSLKMGDFNTPSVFRFFKRKRRLEIYYFKTAARLFIFCLGVVIPSAVKTVFYFPLQAALFLGVNQTWRMLEIYNNSLQSKAVQRLCYCYLRLHLVWKTPRPTTFQQEFRD